MDDNRQDVLGVRSAIQPKSQGRRCFEVERLPGEGAHEIVQAAARDRNRSQIDGGAVAHALQRAVRSRRVRGPQDSVPAQDVAHRFLQRADHQVTREAQREGQVVHVGRGIEEMLEPQPALGRRERTGVERRCARAQLGAAHRPCHPGLDRPRQVRGGGGVEDVADADLDTGRRCQPAGDLSCEQGVATDVEEVVVAAEIGGAEQVTPDVEHHRLERAARAAGHDGRDRGIDRVRQGRGVDLAVRIERQRLHRHDGRGDHVVGQHAPEGLDDRPVREAVLRTGRADDVGHQPPAAHCHCGIDDAGGTS